MPMYNLLEYGDKYSMTSGSLWNYYREEINDSAIGNNKDDKINKNETIKIFSIEDKYNRKNIR